MKIYLSIIVPIHNEAAVLVSSIPKIIDATAKITPFYEIIIAEDGSRDRSYEIAKKLAKTNPAVRVLHSSHRLGRGEALNRAIRTAKGKIAVYMDADLSSDLRYLKPLVERIEDGASISTGSRLMKDSKASRPVKRDVASRGFNTLVRLLLGSKLYDHQCGFKAFRKKDVLPLLKKVKDKYWFWDTEILVRAQREGMRVDEIPIDWAHGRFTKVDFTKDVLYMFGKILELKKELG
ncbi:MAG: glycosyltransferase family 2 protein [Candidatus Micrarchaeota archaeon]|nr:glycosyltransferase family 2 protein [Candidatus Micrarchaeota archaeon]